MEAIVSHSFNIVILALCFGAFFIKNTQLLKIAGVTGAIVLFAVHAADSVPATPISNITLVMINAFYLFKVYTQQHS